MARGKGGGGGGGGSFAAWLRWPAWALALLAFASAFTPLERGLLTALKGVLCLFSAVGAGMALAQGRRLPFFLYAFLVLLLNPIRPFHFSPEIWRLILAGAAIWLVADHLPGRD
jgi:hypothetical protein